MEIKPKLNINIGKGAKNSTASSDYYPCGPWKASSDLYNPWQVVWYHSAYHLDPGQQPFNYQKNDYNYLGFIDSTKNYDFKVIEGQDKSHIIEHFKNADGTEDVDAQTDAGYELLGISGKDMIGEKGKYDPENARIRGGFEKYTLYFDEPGNVTFTIQEAGSSDIYYFHTIIVRPDFNLEVSLSDSILYGEEDLIFSEAKRTECTDYDEMYNGGGFDGKYNYEITEGGEYATLSRAYFDEAFLINAREEGQSFEGTGDDVYLYMNGLEPLDSAFVTVKISTTDGAVNTITQVVKDVPNDYYELGVAISPGELNSGDTADVFLSRKVAGSDTSSSGGYDYEPFPEGQIFNASIVKGKEYANLYDPAEERTDYELNDVEQGFKLIINPGVDTNNVEIKIKVSTTISDETSSPLTAPAGNNHPVKVVTTTTTTHKLKKKVTSSGGNKTAFIGVPSGKEIFGIGKAMIGNNIVVQFEPAELTSGDTATVHIYKKGSGGELVPFPQGQKFEVGIFDGCDYGDLFINNTRGTYFTNVEDSIKYIVEDSVNVDSAKVSLRVGIVQTANQSAPQMQPTATEANYSKRKGVKTAASKAKNINKLTATSCSLQPFVYDEYGTSTANIKPTIKIMLGETKYFGVKKKKDAEEYEIVEIPTNYGDEPKWKNVTLNSEWEWQKISSVWGSDPIEKLGSKSGVYWEKKWFDKSNNKNKSLEAGMIRLIGRYWEEGKVDSFKIKLKTTATYNNTEVMVKVIKPGKLLIKGQSPTYEKAKDVHNNEYSIDSLCIYWGGKIGIPPQMIKGQMLQESAKKDFGGSTGWGFAPSYRYEPYTVQFSKITTKILKNNKNPFIVTKTEMGKPGAASVPTKTEHQHVLYHHYFENAQSVWDIIEANSKLINIDNVSTYGFQYKGTGPDTLKKGQIKSRLYSIVTNTYTDYLKGKKDEEGNRAGGYELVIKLKYKLDIDAILNRAQQTEANDSARVATINYFKNDYQHKRSSIKGLDNIPAQTRIASSYGLLQTLYVTAEDEHNYPTGNNNNPELLNEVDTSMVYSIKHLKKLFKKNGFSLDNKNDNWASNYIGKNSKGEVIFAKRDAGFEGALTVMYHLWNSGYSNYYNEVLDKSEKFIPRRK